MPARQQPSAQRALVPAAALLALPFLLLAACEGERSPTAAQAAERPAAAAAQVGASLTAALSLPVNQSGSTTSLTPLFKLTQTGTGPNGQFIITNTSNTTPALYASTFGTGRAGEFRVNAAGNLQPAIFAQSNGSGPAVWFQINNESNPSQVIFATTKGIGRAGWFQITNKSNTKPSLYAVTAGTGWAAYFLGTSKGVRIQTSSGTGLQVAGGTKQAVVATPSGARSLYTEESSEVWFTDYGFGRLTDGRARVLLDPAFAQTINPGEPYHVFVQAYGNAELYVPERTPLGFVVALRGGEADAEFSYRVVAKRLGFERTRLEPAP